MSDLPRYTLGSLLALVALNAFGGGIYGLMGAKEIPLRWLEGSPFTSYFLPSLILFSVVGGSLALGAIAVFASWRSARVLSTNAGIVLLLWITVQVAFIGFVSWLQPVMGIVALAFVILARSLPDLIPPRARRDAELTP
jgi:hypothetical protein